TTYHYQELCGVHSCRCGSLPAQYQQDRTAHFSLHRRAGKDIRIGRQYAVGARSNPLCARAFVAPGLFLTPSPGGPNMRETLSTKTFIEPAREIRVWREADVVVVGGGPGGIGAAISAARR